MLTLPENKHITKRYTLSEIKAQIEEGEYSAELLLQHLCAHANEMQRENARLRDDCLRMARALGIEEQYRHLLPNDQGHEPAPRKEPTHGN